MSARHTRNSLAPVAAQIDDVLRAVRSVAEEVTEIKEESIRFRTSSEMRLDSLESSIKAKAQWRDKLRFGVLMAAISAGIGLFLNAIL